MSQYPQLDEAFKKLKEQGLSNLQITADARLQGWSNEEIDAALRTVEERMQPAIPHAPAQSAPPVVASWASAEVAPITTPPPAPLPEPTSVVPPMASAPSESLLIKNAQPSYQPAPAPVAEVRARRGVNVQLVGIVIGVVLILCMCGVAGAYMYLNGFNPFGKAPYAEDTFASDLFSKLQEIESGESRIKLSAYTKERDADAKPFVTKTEGKEEVLAQYKRDSERMETLSQIRNELVYSSDYYTTGNVTYPKSLEAFRAAQDKKSSIAIRGFKPDPLTQRQFSYVQTQDGAGFELKATFETDAAITKIEDSYEFSSTTTKIEGKTVTFTQMSPSYIYFPAEPPKTLFEELATYTSFIKNDFSVSGELVALREKNKGSAASSSGSVQLDLEGDLDDLTYHLNAEIRVIDGAFYFIINNLPGLFSGFLPKEQWIVWKPGSDEMGFFDLEELNKEYEETQAAYNEYKLKIVKFADDTGLFIFKNTPKLEQVDGKMLYRYDIAFRKEAVVPFYTLLLDETKKNELMAERMPLVTESTLEMLNSESFSEMFDYYNNNTNLTIWVTGEGVPAKISYTLRVVPEDTEGPLKDRQLMLELLFGFDRVNEDIKIEVPEGAKDFEEAMDTQLGGAMGDARMKGADAAIQSMVNNMRAQMEIYGSKPDGSVNYAGGCSNVNIVTMLNDIATRSATPYCSDSADQWVVAAPLKTKGYVCADSTGYSEKYDTAIISSGLACP